VKDKIAIIVAVIVTFIYGIALVAMWMKVGDIEPDWGRRLVLLTGLEAIVFAAVGWLFGKEVNRHAVDAAAEANARLRDEARERGSVEGKGQALADAIRTNSRDGNAFADGPSLRDLADRLFPPQ